MKQFFCAALLASSLSYADEVLLEAPSLPSQAELQLPTPHFEPQPYKSPFLAVTLSVIPGLGHLYLGDGQAAGALMGSAGLTAGLAMSDFSDKSVQANSILALQNISFYGIYSAYRDVRNYNGNSGYSYKMPQDSLADLSYAPFKWSIIKKPEVWGGLLGAFTLASTVGYFYAKSSVALSSGGKTVPAMALPIGIGEESFFRGYLQPMFSEALTPWGGIAASSVAFGAAHVFNAQALDGEQRRRYYSLVLPFITTFGTYLGWLSYKNNSLQESVALHTWYDLIIFSVSAMATEAAICGNSRFALSLPF